MSQPIGYYTSYTPVNDKGTPLDLLQDNFGSQLEEMGKGEKLALLATITANLCICTCSDSAESLEETYQRLPDSIAMSGDLEELLEPLDQIHVNDFYGLCVALANQLHSGIYAED